MEMVRKRVRLQNAFDELSTESKCLMSEFQQIKLIKARLQAQIRFLRSRVKLIKECTKPTEGVKEPVLARDESAELPSSILKSSKSLLLKPVLPRLPPMPITGDVNTEAALKRVVNTEATIKGVVNPPQAAIKWETSHYAGVNQTLVNHKPVGIFKPMSRCDANGLPPSKKSGKRKVSWQDEMQIKI